VSRNIVLVALAFEVTACASQLGALRRAEGQPVPAVDAARSDGEAPGKCLAREMDLILLRRWREDAGIPIDLSFVVGADGSISQFEVLTRAVPKDMSENMRSLLSTKCALTPARDAEGKPLAMEYAVTVQ